MAWTRMTSKRGFKFGEGQWKVPSKVVKPGGNWWMREHQALKPYKNGRNWRKHGKGGENAVENYETSSGKSWEVKEVCVCVIFRSWNIPGTPRNSCEIWFFADQLIGSIGPHETQDQHTTRLISKSCLVSIWQSHQHFILLLPTIMERK